MTSLVDNINARIVEIETIEVHLKRLKENLQTSSVELEMTMERDSSQYKEIPHLEEELSICKSELKDYDQVINMWLSLLSSVFI